MKSCGIMQSLPREEVLTMAEQLQPIDITNQPDVVRLAEEVKSTKQSRLLRRRGEDLAVLNPLAPRRRRVSRGKLLTQDDALFRLIASADGPDDGVTDVSENKAKYLADAYADTHE